MSGNPYQQPPPDPSRHQTAHGFVRFILDARHRPSTSFIRIPEDRPSVLEEYAQLLTEARDSADISAAQAASPTSMSSGSDRDLRRRFNRDPQLSDNALPSIHSLQNPSLPAPPSLPPLRWLGSRARPSMAAPGESGGRSSRYRPRPLERHRAGGESRSSSNIPDMMRSLDDANTHHRTLLDLTTSSSSLLGLGSPPPAPPFHDQTEESRRIKRRKLDSDRLTPTFKGFRYGRYGQVEPGQLTMEIVSCDGGLYEGLPQNANYAAENILKNDDSVYCTKGNRCNIILRHQGATVFSLKELVIKAPGSNYSSPVREGMVFVSMNSDELLTRTAQYQIQYQPSRSSRPSPTIYSIRHDDDSHPIGRYAYRRSVIMGNPLDDDDDDHRTAQIPPEFSASTTPFTVTTECSDDESDGDTNQVTSTYRARRRTPNRIGALPFESESSDEGGNDIWGPSGSVLATFDDMTRSHYLSARGRSERDGGASSRADNMTLDEAREANQIATQDAVRAVGGELMTPLAHFYIEKNKNKCTVRFDPPVSGRFILLKMWSSQHDPHKNIDIRGVIAKGFAGPRFCPAVELR